MLSPFKFRMVITQSLYDEMVKNSSHIDGISVVHPHSEQIAGMTGRGEAGDNTSCDENGCQLSPASPLPPNPPNPSSWKCHFDDGVYMLSSSPFKIRIVITQSLYDEMIKNSSHIDGISLEIFPFRA